MGDKPQFATTKEFRQSDGRLGKIETFFYGNLTWKNSQSIENIRMNELKKCLIIILTLAAYVFLSFNNIHD